MERTVERERKLTAFEIDLGDLEALVQRLYQLFREEDYIVCKIDIPLKQEYLSFKSVQEIKEYGLLKGRINKFYIRIFDHHCRSISIRSGGEIIFLSSVSVSSESEAWCAGAIETISSFLHTRRVWYHWFITWPFTLLALILVGIPYAFEKYAQKDVLQNKPFAIGWLIILILFFILSLAKGKLLPAATLNISNEEGFLRRRAPELTLVIALLSAVLTIIGWFVSK